LRLIVIGDIHAQAGKFWAMLRDAGLVDEANQPTALLPQGEVKLILLGDLVHAKSRERYAAMIRAGRYDEYNPEHLAKAEAVQAAFLGEVKRFADALPEGAMEILLGNHDFNAITPSQGPLRTDDVLHLEWKESALTPELASWIASWKTELAIEGIHFAHVGPLPEHNRYDNGFYLENRRRWIYSDQDFLAETPYRLGIYGHTPVRGGVNIASQGRALLLDTNGHQDEYCYLVIEFERDRYRLRLKGLFFDEYIPR